MSVQLRSLLRPALVGTAAGILVLGVGGRVAMRVIALGGGAEPVFSIGGSVEVLAAGAWRGAVGGLLYWLVASLIRWTVPWRGLVTGALLFLVATLTLRPSLREQVAALDAAPLALGLFGSVFLLYGLAVDLVITLSDRRRRARGGAGAILVP